MNLNEYQMEVLRTASAGKGPMMELAVSSLGLTGEAGEFADMVKKHIGHGHELDREKAAKELGDVLWYVARLAEMIGYDLEEVAQMNIDKLKKRYPEGFSHEASQARVDLHQEIFDGTGTSEDPYVVKGADGQEARFVPTQQRPALENY